MSDLVRADDVIDGEIVDETCLCGNPGRLVVDPFAEGIYGEVRMVVMCEKCEHESCMDI